jgi:dimethylargininase
VRALIRPVPDSIVRCELTHLSRVPIDLERARAQHRDYERAMDRLGCTVSQLPAEHDHPDSVFVEDAAVVLDELAVITRPGAPSRRGETASVAAMLAAFRPLERISGPATLDGGDVLRLGRVLYVGVGGRTDHAGAEQLATFVRPAGYEVRTVEITGCLHLKSAVTEVAPGMVLVNPDWVGPDTFEGCDAIDVDPSEPFAANVLRLGDTILCQSSYDRTNARLEATGLQVEALDVSELAKAEAGITCCSLILRVASARRRRSQ